jgi:hypothetical protein
VPFVHSDVKTGVFALNLINVNAVKVGPAMTVRNLCVRMLAPLVSCVLLQILALAFRALAERAASVHCVYRNAKMAVIVRHQIRVHARQDGSIRIAPRRSVNKPVATVVTALEVTFVLVLVIGEARTAELPCVNKIVEMEVSVLLQILACALLVGLAMIAHCQYAIKGFSSLIINCQKPESPMRNQAIGLNIDPATTLHGAMKQVVLTVLRRNSHSPRTPPNLVKIGGE